MNTATKRAAFRTLHDEGFFILPNAWDRGSARRLESAGFSAIASTSSGAAWALGKQDGEMTLDEVLTYLSTLVEGTDLPVNADFEHGFADTITDLQRNVELAVATGVAGLSLEDWSGSKLYSSDEACDRLQAARAQLDVSAPDVVLVGRNENFRDPTMTVSQTVERLVAYSDAGADCLFAPFISDLGAVAELVAAVSPKPLNVVVSSYDVQVEQLAELGVRRVSVGGSLAKRGWDAVDSAIAELCEQNKRWRQ